MLKPTLWQSLPFTAGKDGGQLDSTIRQAMQNAGVHFHPVVECASMLQAMQLIAQGTCAGILPSFAIPKLEPKDVHILDFPPLRTYGRNLVLHWNERQMSRRGVEMSAISKIGSLLNSI